MDWKAGEREFLIYLALNGPADQKTVAETYGFVTPTLNLAKDGLVERGYITLRSREIRGRGAPRKIYGLTPAGLVAAVHEGELWGNIWYVMEHWWDVAPVFIRRYETLKTWGFDGDAKRYCETSLVKNKITIEALGKEGEHVMGRMRDRDLVEADRETNGHDQPDPWMRLLRVIDRGFYTEMHRVHGGPDRDRYLRMVKGDEALLEGWLRWFRWEEKRFRELEEHRRILLNEQPR